MFNNLVINGEILKCCVKLGGYCGPQEVHIVQIMNGEKNLQSRRKGIISLSSPVYVSAAICLPHSVVRKP